MKEVLSKLYCLPFSLPEQISDTNESVQTFFFIHLPYSKGCSFLCVYTIGDQQRYPWEIQSHFPLQKMTQSPQLPPLPLQMKIQLFLPTLPLSFFLKQVFLRNRLIWLVPLAALGPSILAA